MASSTLVVVVVLLILIIFSSNKVYGDEQQLQQESCSTRCGVHNISPPFRLKNSRRKCGDKRYNLSCEDNNQLIMYNGSYGKYYVQSIHYNNFTIRILDFNLRSNNSLPPYYSLGRYNFSSEFQSPYLFYQYKNFSYTDILTKSMIYVTCLNPVEHSSGYMYGPNCMNSSSHLRYGNSFYVSGYNKTLSQLKLGDKCRIELMFLTSSWQVKGGNNNNNISCKNIRRMMFDGIELSWINSLCKDIWSVEFDQYNQPRCVSSGLH
ncbi:unnamed protein product [Lathyrus sativus]|nr:unnamed protein product [Lathyrus sativus]